MGAETLSDRSIIGGLFAALETERANTWIKDIAVRIDSDQEAETLAFMSGSPVMREWIGGRLVKGFDVRTIRTANLHWESTIEFLSREIQRDKTGQIAARIKELARRAATHPQKLISELILAGENSLCYDGQYFFDTDHSEGESGAQSNSITIEMSELNVPLAQQGTPIRPSAWAFASAVCSALAHMGTLKDDQGEPYHHSLARADGDPKTFIVMAPNSFLYTQTDLGAREFAWGTPNPLIVMPGVQVKLLFNPRITWTDKFAVFRTDDTVKPFLYQVETEIMIKALTEGSDYEFNNDRHLYGVDAWYNVNYAFWQHAVLVQLV